MILPYKGKTPLIHPSVFVAPTAIIIGDVEIAAGASVWFGAVDAIRHAAARYCELVENYRRTDPSQT
jgi:serine acetyltransferase